MLSWQTVSRRRDLRVCKGVSRYRECIPPKRPYCGCRIEVTSKWVAWSAEHNQKRGVSLKGVSHLAGEVACKTRRSRETPKTLLKRGYAVLAWRVVVCRALKKVKKGCLGEVAGRPSAVQ